MIIDFDGEIINTLECHFMFHLGNMNDDIEFEYSEGTGAARGCGATLFDQFWYFGGTGSTLRQVLSDFCSEIVFIIF